jgi:hypothetical protein
MATVTSVVIAAPGCQRSQPPSAFQRIWVIQGTWLNQVAYHDPRVARALFQPPSVVLGARPGRSIPMTSFMWPSYRWFSGEPRYWLKGFTSVVYDPENWKATPLRERQHPVVYFRRFSALGHTYDTRVILTPHPNLTSVPDADCVARTDESQEDAFLRCDLIGRAAQYGDMVEVQAQQMESDPAAYRSFVERAAQQARAANPHVLVIAGLSTGVAFSGKQMYASWNSVRDLVDGYYLSITGTDRVPTALAFLRMLPLPHATSSSTPHS